ncbi:conserved Plasmodium protein, unknown function [Plasmodium ovale]|uniref:Programmed cell death protein 2 C-terminal domain-containing protein n=1 Tax=Plasmodium ovale TaxID=36330 RepID=A0A1C3KNE5_PLAOA|nr:conserved Plasmodium protein, unknown function [Plasmodium ovale]
MANTLLGYVRGRRKRSELQEKEKINKKFISKIGGRPFWLDRINLPHEQNFYCLVCSNLMTFLLQLYAPIENVSNCFHRCVYVFLCMHCGDQVKCFRTQLPRNNPFYNYYLAEDNCAGGGSDASSVSCSSRSSRSSRSSHSSRSAANSSYRVDGSELGEMGDPLAADYATLTKEDKKIFHKKLEYFFCCSVCGIPCVNKRKKHRVCKLKKHVVFNEDKIYISEEDDDESSSIDTGSSLDRDDASIAKRESHDCAVGSDHVGGTIGAVARDDCVVGTIGAVARDDCVGVEDELDCSEMKAMEHIQKEVLSKRKIDAVYLNYLKKLSKFPNQIIRYSYNGTALYTTSERFNKNRNNLYDGQCQYKKVFSRDDIPYCHICKKKKVFEFQVLSTVINYIKVKKNISIKNNISMNLYFTNIDVYTCENNCDMYDINNDEKCNRGTGTSRYIQEYACVQVEN